MYRIIVHAAIGLVVLYGSCIALIQLLPVVFNDHSLVVEKQHVVAALPVRLIIPRINVDAPIDPLGVTPEGNMDVPDHAERVGWYKYGSIPSMTGSAVLAGHLDTASGKPAVFWDLHLLEAGDDVFVTDALGVSHTFRVDHVSVYPQNNKSQEEIFGQTDGSFLNLITCNGTWQNSNGTYDKRIVVFTKAE